MHLQQSPLYREYIQKLGWQVIPIDENFIFIKRIPFIGNLAKLQRPTKLPKLDRLVQLVQKYHISRLAIEPESDQSQTQFTTWLQKVHPHVQLNTSPFLPTKTILIDLTSEKNIIFNKFSQAKRRAVRRAQKNSLIIKESTNISDLIKIKNRSAGFLGFITTYGVRELWDTFAPDNATILLAYKATHNHQPLTTNHELVAGLLLIFHDDIAYYWIAGSTHIGKKLFAPTLLVWNALKISKIRGMKKFDFVGTWDDRLPKLNTQWLGFTKFKAGFGGVDYYYPILI